MASAMKRCVLALVLVTACRKGATEARPPDAGQASDAAGAARAPASAFASASASASASVEPVEPGEPVEARRAIVRRVEDEPALAAARDVVARHFGGAVPSELSVQAIDRTGPGGRAVLAERAKPPGSPLAVAIDASSAVRWAKERPVAGIVPPVGPIALAPGPLGRVAIAVCDPPTARVALRIWDEDGSPFADFDAMDMDDCTAVSLLRWPRRGFVIVATRGGATRAQLVSDAGGLAWRRGIDLGARSITGAPASIAADTDDSLVLVQYGAVSPEPGARPHALAFRYDARGEPLWPAPVDLGVAPVSRPDDRIVLARPRAGVVRATLAKGVDVEVSSAGAVTRQRQ